MGGTSDVAISSQYFESLKQINEHGAKYWSARAIPALLGYSQWRRFETTIERAISSCKNQEIRLIIILLVPAEWLDWRR